MLPYFIKAEDNERGASQFHGAGGPDGGPRGDQPGQQRGRAPPSRHDRAARVNLAGLAAIDVHTHAEVSNSGRSSLSQDLEQASTEHFRLEHVRRPTLDEIAAYYRGRAMACVVFPVDAEPTAGVPPVPNEEVAKAARAHPDVLIPFASIEPAKGKAGARQARRLVAEHGVKGFKFHPNARSSTPTTAPPTCSTRRSRSWACRWCSTPA